jgi:hypothetical protein
MSWGRLGYADRKELYKKSHLQCITRYSNCFLHSVAGSIYVFDHIENKLEYMGSPLIKDQCIVIALFVHLHVSVHHFSFLEHSGAYLANILTQDHKTEI